MASSRLPALSPCARRQIGSGPAAGRAGGEDGRLPGDGGPGSAASCRGGGRAGAEGPREPTGPRPGLAAAAVGASHGRAEQGRSFVFVWQKRKGRKSPGPFPASPQIEPPPCSERLWRPVALSTLPARPGFSRPASASPQEPHLWSTRGPNLGQRDPPPGPVRGRDTPGQAARKSASFSVGPRVPSAPALGGHASGIEETFSGLRGFRLGFASPTQRSEAWASARLCAAFRAEPANVSCGEGGNLLGSNSTA